MLYWKFTLGLFDDPYVDPDRADRVVGSEENAQLALKRLTKRSHCSRTRQYRPVETEKVSNDRSHCPNANRSLLGGYSGVPMRDVTVLMELRQRS
jgi:beta-glucosidase